MHRRIPRHLLQVALCAELVACLERREDPQWDDDSATDVSSDPTPDPTHDPTPDPTPEPTPTPPGDCIRVPGGTTAGIGFHTLAQYVWLGEGVDVDWHKIVVPPAPPAIPARPSILQVFPIGETLDESVERLDAYLTGVDLSGYDFLVFGEENGWWDSWPLILTGLYDHLKSAYPDAPPVLQWYSPPQGAPHVEVPADGWIIDEYGVSGEALRPTVMKHVATRKPLLLVVWASNYAGYPGWSEWSGSSIEQVELAEEFGLPMAFFTVAGPLGSTGTWWSDSDPETVLWRSWYESVRAAANAVDPQFLPSPSANHSDGAGREVAGGDDGLWRWTEDFATADFVDEADVEGFLALRWDPAGHALWLEPRPTVLHAPCAGSLTWRLESTTAMNDAVVTVVGSVDSGARATLALSTDGLSWTEAAADAGGPFALSLTQPPGGASTLWVRISGNVPPDGPAAVRFDAVDVDVAVAPPDTTLHLDPPGGAATWADSFETDAYLALATMDNPTAIQWTGSALTLAGLMGTTNSAALTFRFDSTVPITSITATVSSGYASHPAWASWNEIRVWLPDGTPLGMDSTIPYDSGTYLGPISVTASPPSGTTAFTVEASMFSESGVANPMTNRLDDIQVSISP